MIIFPVIIMFLFGTVVGCGMSYYFLSTNYFYDYLHDEILVLRKDLAMQHQVVIALIDELRSI